MLAVRGSGRGLGAITSLAVLGMAAIAVVSLFYVLGILPFGAQLTVSAVGLVLIAGWLPPGSPARMTLDVAWRLLSGSGFPGVSGVLIVLSQRLPGHAARG